MEWLAQNWLVVLLIVGVLLLLSRRGRRHGLAGHGMHGMHDGPAADAPAVDPVSGERVSRDNAVTSVHQGRVYYFASRENRDRFETDPARFASAQAGEDRPHRHGGRGCC